MWYVGIICRSYRDGLFFSRERRRRRKEGKRIVDRSLDRAKTHWYTGTQTYTARRLVFFSLLQRVPLFFLPRIRLFAAPALFSFQHSPRLDSPSPSFNHFPSKHFFNPLRFSSLEICRLFSFFRRWGGEGSWKHRSIFRSLNFLS